MLFVHVLGDIVVVVTKFNSMIATLFGQQIIWFSIQKTWYVSFGTLYDSDKKVLDASGNGKYERIDGTSIGVVTLKEELIPW